MLSLKNISSIAVISPLADDSLNQLGGWTKQQPEENVVTILERIECRGDVRVEWAMGYTVTDERSGVKVGGGVESETVDKGDVKTAVSDVVQIAKRCNVAIVVVGKSTDTSLESNSRTSLELSGEQEALVKAIYDTGIPTVVMLINGRFLTINWIAEKIPAIVEAWFLGEGGESTDCRRYSTLSARCNLMSALHTLHPRDQDVLIDGARILQSSYDQPVTLKRKK